MAVIREKEILTKLLRNFRVMPCLWDRTHDDYNNKLKRTEGYLQLLKLFKVYEPYATVKDLKKKIEHMRAAYRRLHLKALKAQIQGKPYEPTLWYYNELTFLDGSSATQISDYETMEQDENEDEVEEMLPLLDELDTDEKYGQVNSNGTILKVDYLKSESLSNSPLAPPTKKEPNYVFLNEESGSVTNHTDLSAVTDQNISNNVEESSSVECFGKTVASQLSELQPLQRYVAEKLISEVIFYGRLDKLCPESFIKLNNP